ncbi:MFS transporter [Staphylococcus pseudintermedius]|nr:MFS transporter [Staphylococcus pseudintermedius]
MQKILDKLNFKDRKTLIGFLSVVTAGQLIYSSFEAFKGTFYNLLLEVLNVSNAELGAIFGLIGISIFFYIPGGWINNRFSIKSILIVGLLIRFITISVIIFFSPTFQVLKIIVIIWGIVDSFFWPAVLNGVIFFTDQSKRGMGFGLLESVRRAEEMLMNLLIVGIMSLVSGIVVFKGGMLAYNLLIIPLILLIIKYVPKNGIAAMDEEEKTEITGNKSLEALKGLFYVLLKPKVWLASISAMSIYWGYIILIYSVPYLQKTFDLSTTQTALFGIFNTGLMGVLMGVSAGIISDYVFKSSSKMIFAALLLSSIILLGVVFIKGSLFVSMALLIAFSVTTFLAKSVILAPIAEFDIPKKYAGSAMSVGSFAAYAPIFWVYTMNGKLLDAHQDNVVEAYRIIFEIGIIVAFLGSVCTLILLMLNRKSSRQVTE